MKRRYYLSFATGILSGLTALGFLFLMAYSIISMSTVAKVISDTTDELAGIKLIAYAGLSYLVAILCIIISGALAGYRGTLTYFYIKTATMGEEFYAERRKSTIGFAVLTAIMLGAFIALYFALESTENKTVLTALIAFIVDYSLLIVLPLIERRIVAYLSKRPKKVEVVSAERFDKDKITKELDALADEEANGKREESSLADEEANGKREENSLADEEANAEEQIEQAIEENSEEETKEQGEN